MKLEPFGDCKTPFVQWIGSQLHSARSSCLVLFLQVEPTYHDVACALEAWNLRALLATSGSK